MDVLQQLLQLNIPMTGILWDGTACRQRLLPSAVVRVGANFVAPSVSVCDDLGIYLDADNSLLPTHDSRSVSRCTSHLFAGYALSVGRSRRRAVSGRLLCRLFCRASATAMRHSSDKQPSEHQRLRSVMNARARLILALVGGTT
jgi:hypothetical protein